MNKTRNTQPILGTTIAYHLLPGVAILAAYILATPILRKLGLPSVMALWQICLLVIIPLELGLIFWPVQNLPSSLMWPGAFSLSCI